MGCSMLRRTGLIVVTLLLQACGATMLRTTCEQPRVSNFGVPTSHVIVLSHAYAGGDAEQKQTAERLNELARLQALQGAASLGRTQITFVEGGPDNEACDIEEVYDRVVENPTSYFWRRAFHSAVFVWGEIFPDKLGLQVQSHMRVFWNGDAQRKLRLQWQGLDQGEPIEFQASLPSGTISLPIFTVTEQVQASIRLALERTFSQQSPEPPHGPACNGLPPRFVVESWRPPWLQLVRRDFTSCWLRVDAEVLDSQLALRHVLFGRAVAAYLSHRVYPALSSDRALHEALTSLRRQLGPQGRAQASSAMAWADIMEATSNWTVRGAVQPGWTDRGVGQNPTERDAQQRQRSAAALRRAAALLPNSVDALNLAILGSLQICCGGPRARQDIEEIQHMVDNANLLDPGHPEVLVNTVAWYRMLGSLPADVLPMTAAQLALRLDKATALQRDWKRFSKR